MVAEFLTKNAIGLILLFGCVLGLLLMPFYRKKYQFGRHQLVNHVISFLLWSCIVVTVGSYVETLVNDININFLTPGIIQFICTSIIVVMFLRKMFVMIDMMEKKQVAKGSDITNARIISRVLKIVIVMIVVLLYGEHFGMSLSGLLTFGGIGGIAVGMAGKDILSNFFSGIMLYFDRPFNIGDWISSPDRHIEGVVAEIGWRITRITTFDNRPLYVPNSAFTDISVENPGRMTNRRIKTSLGLRYEDADKVEIIVKEIRAYLETNDDIDHQRTLLVYFNDFGDSALNILVYCFTKTTVWKEWLEAQQTIYLKFIEIVHRHGADFAFPSQTLYIEKSSPDGR